MKRTKRLVLRSLILSMTILSASGCESLTAPEPIALEAQPSTPVVRRNPITVLGFTFVYYRCDYTITLQAIGGRKNQSAVLQMAVLRSGDGTRLGSIPLSELISWFGTDKVRSGTSVSASLYDEVLGPWSRTVEFIYTDSKGANRTTSWSINCR